MGLLTPLCWPLQNPVKPPSFGFLAPAEGRAPFLPLLSCHVLSLGGQWAGQRGQRRRVEPRQGVCPPQIAPLVRGKHFSSICLHMSYGANSQPAPDQDSASCPFLLLAVDSGSAFSLPLAPQHSQLQVLYAGTPPPPRCPPAAAPAPSSGLAWVGTGLAGAQLWGPALPKKGGCDCPEGRSAAPGLRGPVRGASSPGLPQTLLLSPALLWATPSTCCPLLPPSYMHLRRAWDSSRLHLGAWPLHIPRACPALPDSRPLGLCFSLAQGAGAGRLWKRGLGGRDGDALPWLCLAESICPLVPQFRI